MDDLKDIQGRNLSKFLDSEVRTNPFGDNHSAERAYRRAERLIAGVFLLTNHIDPQESLRNESRKTAMQLLSNILEIRDEMRSSGSSKVVQLQSTIRKLISQIKILTVSGFVSSQNAEIISEVIDELGSFILLAQKSNLSESVKLSRESLIDDRLNYKGHIKDIRDMANIKDRKLIKDAQQSDVHPATSNTNSRSASILDVLKVGGELNIRDISSNLPEYGEKTIQRELVLLVQRGLVQRMGSKRWSRYSLVG